MYSLEEFKKIKTKEEEKQAKKGSGFVPIKKESNDLFSKFKAATVYDAPKQSGMVGPAGGIMTERKIELPVTPLSAKKQVTPSLPTFRDDAHRNLYKNSLQTQAKGYEQEVNKHLTGWRANAITTDPKLTEANKKLSDVRKQLEQIGKLEQAETYGQKYLDGQYDDNFIGQTKANYAVGRMGQDSSMAWNAYLNNPTEANRKYAERIDEVMQKFRDANAETLADDATLPWLSQSFAQYVPQLIDQTKAGAAGALGGAVVGGTVAPVVGAVGGARVGYTAGVGMQSYDLMRGAAFKSLIDAGVDEETALRAANDEALISSLVEMGDAAVDIMTLGGLSALKGGIAGAFKTAAGDSAKKKAMLALANYGINIGSEGLEEAVQEAVSIGNARRIANGDMSLNGLVGNSIGVAGDAIAGRDADARESIFGAAKEGAKISAVMAGADAVVSRTGEAYRKYLDAKYSKAEEPAAETEQLNTTTEQLNRTTPQNPVTVHETSISEELSNSPAEMRTQPTEAQKKPHGVESKIRARESGYIDEYYHENGARVMKAEAEKRGSVRDAEDIYRPYYTAGVMGLDFSEVEITATAKLADPLVAQDMYRAGIADRQADMTARLQGQGKIPRQTPGVLLRTEAVTEKQRALANLVAKVGKMEVVLVDELPKRDNGRYKDGRIYVSLKAESFSGALFHEAVHYIAQANVKGYDRMAQTVMRMVAEIEGVSVDKYVRKYEKAYAEDIAGGNYNALAIREELVADAFQMLAADEARLNSLIAELKQSEPTVLNQIKEFLDSLLETLKGLVKDGRFHAFAEDINKDIENTKKLQKIFAEELKTAGDNVWKTASATNGTADALTTDDLQAANDILPPEGENVRMSRRLWEESAPKQEIKVKPSGEVAAKMSEAKSGKEVLIDAYKANGFSKKEIDKKVSFIDGVAEFLDKAALDLHFVNLTDINDAKLVISPRDGSIVLSAMVKNGEYAVNFDLTKICAKRVAMSSFIDTLAKRKGRSGADTMLEEISLTSSNIYKMNEILRDAGYETACLGCFVESRRYNIETWATEFLDIWNGMVDKYGGSEFFGFSKQDVFVNDLTHDQVEKLNDELETYGKTKDNKKLTDKTKKIEDLIKNVPAMRKKLKMADLITADGRTNLHKKYPELESLLLQHYGSNTPKSVEVFTPYNNEIALMNDKVGEQGLAEYLHSIAGVRSQSFSDFIITHVFDVLQKTADMEAKRLPGHVYTKVPARARLFGMTGEKHNMSIMFNIDPDVSWEYAGLREDGSYFVGDEATSKKEVDAGRERTFVQSFPWDEAVAIQNDPRYSANCGIIGVSYSYNANMKMLDDPEIPYIIGYHASGMPTEIKAATHISLAADYTPVQNTLEFKGFKKVTSKSETVPPYATWATGKKKATGKGVEDAFDIKESFKKNGAKETLRKLFALAEDKEYALDTATAKIGSKKQNGHGDFDIYGDLAKTKNPKKTADNYIDWCMEKGFLPAFYEFALHENYYKFLFDFRVYDGVTGKYAPQKAVTTTFPENFLELLDGYLKEEEAYNERQAEKFEPTLDEIYESLKADGGRRSARGLDEEYMAAVESGDMAKAQEMVDAAAEEAMPKSKLRTPDGKLRKVYHGTPETEFNEFKDKYIGMSSGDDGFFGMGHYFAFSRGEAAYYGRGRVIEAFLDLKNPFNFEKEFRMYKGKKASSGDAPDAVALMNFVDKFPDIAKRVSLSAVKKGEYEYRDISLEKFSKELKSIIDTKDFHMDEVANEYGETETIVYTDVEEKQYEYDGKVHKYKEYGWQQRFCGVPNPVDVAWLYMKEGVYQTIDMPNFTSLILDNNREFTAELKKRGYDGTIQSEYGDEAVAFDSSQIKQADPVTYDNEGNIIPLSERFNSESKDIRYSHSDDYYDDYEGETFETEALAELNSVILEFGDITEGSMPHARDVERISREFLRKIKSKYPAEEFAEKFGDILRHVMRARNTGDMDTAIRALTILSKEAMERSEKLNTEQRDKYRDVVELLRNTPLEITSAMKEELKDYGGFVKFRNQYFNRMKMNNSGEDVEEIYNKIVEAHPDLIASVELQEGEELTKTDMLIALTEIVDHMKPYLENPYEMDMDTYAKDAAYELIGKINEVGTQAGKMLELHSEYKEKMSKMREQLKTDRREQALNRRRSVNRRAIERDVMALRKWITKPSNQNHVPERFRMALATILVKIEASNKNMKFSAADLARFKHEYERLNPEYSGADKGNIRLHDYDEEILTKIGKLEEAAKRSEGSLDLAKMNREQMEWLRQTIKGLRTALVNANKLISAEGNKLATEEGNAFIEMADEMKATPEAGVRRRIMDLFGISMLTPEMFLKGLGDRVYNILWGGYSKGLAKKATLTQEAMDFMDELIDQKDVKAWKDERLKEITLKRKGKNGKEISHTFYMSVPQIMYLHCAVKRHQAKKHLFGDERTEGSGMKIEPEEKIRLKGRKAAMKALEQTDAFKLTEAEVAEVTALLTDRQKEVAEKMQRFLTDVVSEWGNEVSMLMYGYRKFAEDNYVPIIVDNAYVSKMYGKEGGDAKTLQNMGVTKEVSEWANQPIVITDLFDLFSRHIDQMTSYNAFVPILSDTNKFMNYMRLPKAKNDLVTKEEAEEMKSAMSETERQAWEDIRKANEDEEYIEETVEDPGDPDAFVDKKNVASVKKAMKHILGPKAEEYMHKLMLDINGVAKRDDVGDLPQKMLRNMKIASVGANLRVVVQQPMSMFRAMAEMNPVDVLVAPIALPETWKLMRKYAPITLWKDWGGAEMDTGRTLNEMIAGKSVYTHVVEGSMWLAGAFDKLTWGRLWKACEMEVKRKHPDWTGDRFYEAVGERFTQVIDRTQVVDSVLHRSENMRNKSFFIKMTTSFMSEPIKGYNLIYDAVRDFHRDKNPETGKRLMRVCFAHLTNAVMVSMAAALVDSMRNLDDDDDEFWDTWMKASVGDYSKAVTVRGKIAAFWASNLNDNLNPMNMIPFVRDMYSIINGYDVVRTDMSWATDIINWAKKTMKYMEDGTEFNMRGYLLYTAAQFSKVTGLPAKNLERDLYGMADTLIQHAFGDAEGRYNLRTFKYAPGKEDNASMYAEMIVMARFNGDNVLANRIKNDMLNGGLKEDKLDTKLENAYSNRVEIAYIEGDEAKLEESRNQILSDGYKEKVYNKGVRDGAKELFKLALAAKDKDEARRLMKVVEEHNGSTESMMEDFDDTFNN